MNMINLLTGDRLKEYTVFNRQCGTTESIQCQVCGEEMMVERNATGRTMSGRDFIHDVFECPNIGQDWHLQALKIKYELDNTASPSIKKIMQSDLDEIIATRSI